MPHSDCSILDRVKPSLKKTNCFIKIFPNFFMLYLLFTTLCIILYVCINIYRYINVSIKWGHKILFTCVYISMNLYECDSLSLSLSLSLSFSLSFYVNKYVSKLVTLLLLIKMQGKYKKELKLRVQSYFD